jgi:hypothetical protein
MIRRPTDDGWELVRQPDHGRLAADILACLDERPRGPEEGFRAAVAHHDDGWLERDAAPRPGPDGGPETFLDLPLAEHLALSDASVRLAGEHHPYAEAVVARHVAWLHGARPVAEPEAAAERDRIVGRWRETAARQAAAVGVTPADLERDQRLCALVDLLSLWVAGWPETDALALERPDGDEADAELRAGGAVQLPAVLLPAPRRVVVPVARVAGVEPYAERERGVREIDLVPAP